MRYLKIDLCADEVCVFTPRVDVINRPAGATPIDFAFAIHSAVGNKMMVAKVNSKILPLDYKLQTGDIVEVLTSSSVHGPSRDWLNICKTSQARSKINHWFKKERRTENIEAGKEMIEHEAKRLSLNMTSLFKKEYLDQALKRYGFASADDMYAAVGYGTMPAHKFISRLREYNKELQPEKPAATAEITPPKKPQPGSTIEVEGIDNCLVRVSRCCTPLPGDDIIGFITKGRGVSVHRRDCINVREDKLTDDEKARIINCHWVDEAAGKYMCDLQVMSTNRPGIIADVSMALNDYKLSISALNMRITKKNLAVIDVTIEVGDTSQLSNIIKRLYTIPGVYNVLRSHQ